MLSFSFSRLKVNFIFILLCVSIVIQAGKFKLPKFPTLTKKRTQPHTIPSSRTQPHTIPSSASYENIATYQNLPGISGENIKMKQLETKASSMMDVSLHAKKSLSTSSSSSPSLNINGSPSIMKHSESLQRELSLGAENENIKNLKLIGKITKNTALMLAGIGGGITIIKTAVSDDKVIIPSNNNNDSISSNITTQKSTTYKPTKIYIDDKRFNKNDT